MLTLSIAMTIVVCGSARTAIVDIVVVPLLGGALSVAVHPSIAKERSNIKVDQLYNNGAD